MASIPLPALGVHAPQQPDLLEKYGQLMQLKNMQQQSQMQQQEAPLRLQALQQQAQTGDLQLQQQQQSVKDQQAFRAAMTDPEFQGKTIGDVADHLAMKGAISQTSWMAAKKADLEQRQTLANLNKDQLANASAAHAATQQLYNSVMQLPDDQLAANWPQIAQQYDAIPGNNKVPLDPNKPLTKQQLSQFGPMISMQAAYLDNANDRIKKQAETQKAQADAALAQANAERGGTTDTDKFTSDYLKSHNLENTPANRQKAFQEYTKETKIAPAEVRASVMLQTPVAVADPNSPGNTVYVTRKDAIGKTAANSADVKTVQANDKYFTSGKGGQQLTAFNTAINHLGLLDKLAGDLGNSNVQVFNKASQAWAQQTGNPAPTNFEAAKNAMSGEVAAALKASGATDTEIEKVDSTFNRAQSPMQLKGAIATYRMLLNSKATNLKAQYDQGQQGKPNFGEQTAPVATHRFNPATGKIEAIQ